MENQNLGYKYLGHVIRIISDTELIVDVSDDYLSVGDEVIIYTVGDEILDLEGNSLGPYEYDKANLIVKTTTTYYSICETSKRVKEVSFFGNPVSQLTHKIYEQDKLKVESESIEKIEISNKNVILKGDLVKKA